MLDERKFMILRAIIDDYILTAMPVGSRTISRKQGVGFSPATIRNEMSDLEELGYLNGWIDREEVLKTYEVLKKNQYGMYLKDVLEGKYLD